MNKTLSALLLLATIASAAVAEELENDEQAKLAQARSLAKRLSYIADMRLIQSHWELHQSVGHRATPTSLLLHKKSGDLKGFEWNYWNRTFQFDSFDHSNRIDNISISHDGRSIAVGCIGRGSNQVSIYDLLSGNRRLTIESGKSFVPGVAFHPTENKLATASWDRKVKLWDTSTGDELRSFEGHTGQV